MFEIFGPIARPTPSVLPLLLALLPLAGFAGRRAALAALGLVAAASAIFLAWSLRWPAEERMLLAQLGVAARVGQLDLGLALGLDPFGALGAAAVALVGAILVRAQKNRRRVALLSAVASAVLFVVLADGAATLVLALGLASLVGAVAGFVQSTHFAADRVADAAAIGAAAVLFWALGGSWIDGQYTPELDARLVVASAAPHTQPRAFDDDDEDERPTNPVARGARGSLSFAGMPGALVLLDGVWLRDARKHVVSSPFDDVPIAAGSHSVRVHVGPGADDYYVPRFEVAEGQTATLAVRGPTTTFREIGDDLVARDAAGATPGRAALARRKFFGAAVAGVVLALLALALAARARLFPFAPSSREPARALAALGGVALVARLPLGALAPHAASAIAAALAVSSIVAGGVALRGGRRSALLAAEIALAGVGAIAGAPALALVHAAVACALFAREQPTSPFAQLALFPTRAAFAGACAGLAGGTPAAVLVLVATWFSACAIAMPQTPRDAKHVRAGALAAAALVLAFDPRTFGRLTEPLAARLLAPSFRAIDAAHAPSIAIFLLSASLVVFAYVASEPWRRRSKPTTRTSALARLSRSPTAVFAASLAPLPARAVSALARAVAATLVELEARLGSLVHAADWIVRAAGSLLSVADDLALVAPTKHARFALPAERTLRFVLVPVAIAAAALFAVPWAR